MQLTLALKSAFVTQTFLEELLKKLCSGLGGKSTSGQFHQLLTYSDVLYLADTSNAKYFMRWNVEIQSMASSRC